MRWVLALVVVGCGGGSTPDATTACVPPENLCGGPKCNNNAIDGCFIRPDPEVCEFVPANEVCDGLTVTRTCQQLGYYGGKARCGPACTIDEGACEACVPGIRCTTLDELALSVIVASGDRILIASRTAPSVILDRALDEVMQVPLAIEAAASVPGGWIVAAQGNLHRVDRDDAIGAPVALPAGAHPQLVATHDQVLVIWEAATGTSSTVQFTFAALSGELLAPPTTLDTLDAAAGLATTTDGESFFVVAFTKLHRITADGTVTSTTLFFVRESAVALWDGVTGWYVTAAPHAVQRFDANLTLLGSPSFLGAKYAAFLADRDHLLALREGTLLQLVELTVSGGPADSLDLGLYESGAKQLARVGTDVVAAWPRARLRVARVTP